MDFNPFLRWSWSATYLVTIAGSSLHISLRLVIRQFVVLHGRQRKKVELLLIVVVRMGGCSSNSIDFPLSLVGLSIIRQVAVAC